MVARRRSLWRVCHCPKLQHPDSGAAADLYDPLPHLLGPNPLVSSVSQQCWVGRDIVSDASLSKWPAWRASLAAVVVAAVFAGVEAALILTLTVINSRSPRAIPVLLGESC